MKTKIKNADKTKKKEVLQAETVPCFNYLYVNNYIFVGLINV